MFLRKAAEDTAKRFTVNGRKENPCHQGSFFTDRKPARSTEQTAGSIPGSLYGAVLKGTRKSTGASALARRYRPRWQRHTATRRQRKTQIQRRDLRNVLNHDGWAKMEAVEAVDRVLEMTERVLNPASTAIPHRSTRRRCAEQRVDWPVGKILEAQR